MGFGMRKIQTISIMPALPLSLGLAAQDKQTVNGKNDAISQVDHQHDFDWEIGD